MGSEIVAEYAGFLMQYLSLHPAEERRWEGVATRSRRLSDVTSASRVCGYLFFDHNRESDRGPFFVTGLSICYTVCMDLRFTKHAKERMRERGITEEEIRRALAFPDRIDRSLVSPARFIAKKIYYNTYLAEKHLLMVICEEEAEAILVVTIIDTSKIGKYL